jgi:hypothetical protein
MEDGRWKMEECGSVLRAWKEVFYTAWFSFFLRNYSAQAA